MTEVKFCNEKKSSVLLNSILFLKYEAYSVADLLAEKNYNILPR